MQVKAHAALKYVWGGCKQTAERVQDGDMHSNLSCLRVTHTCAVQASKQPTCMLTRAVEAMLYR